MTDEGIGRYANVYESIRRYVERSGVLGVLVCWCVGVLRVGALACWRVGLLACWVCWGVLRVGLQRSKLALHGSASCPFSVVALPRGLHLTNSDFRHCQWRRGCKKVLAYSVPCCRSTCSCWLPAVRAVLSFRRVGGPRRVTNIPGNRGATHFTCHRPPTSLFSFE